MSTDRRLKTLKLRMKSLKTSFTLIKTFVEEYEEEQHAVEVPVRLESLTKLWADFCTVQSELETIDEAGIEQHLKDRATYESSYYKVKGFLLSVNKAVPPSPTLTASHSNPQGPTSSHVRLPDIKLPVFSGNLDHWMNFHDLYMSLVHSSADLSNIQKFYYLRSSLSGDALKLVQTIPITAANYPVAWNLLEEHFQNKPRLKQSYLNALFEFSTLKRESAADLHTLVERFESNVKVLQQLGEKTEFWDLILIRMLSVRLDATTRRDWEEYSSTKADVTFKDLTSFIQRRVSVLQTLHVKGVETPPSSSSSSQPKKFTQRPTACHTVSNITTDRKCFICSEHHPLYMCPTFSKLAVEDKEKEVRRLQLCRNCLRKGHLVRECTSSSSCRKCKNRHHTQLCNVETATVANSHPTTSSKPTTTTSTEEQPRTSASSTVTELPTYTATERKQTTVLLATAVVLFVDDNGTEHAMRALLDSGSECCFVSERFLQTINVPRKKVSVPVSGIGQSTVNVKFSVLANIRSRICNYSTSVECLVLPRLTMDLPSSSIDASTWSIPPGIQLADPNFYSRKAIDLVLGAEVFYDIFHVSGRIQIGDSLPPLINSTLGWVVSGRTSSPPSKRPLIANVASIADLSHMMERFWTIEEGTSSPCYSIEEAACEAHFKQNVSRNQEGRYTVRLPVKPDVLPSLGDNRRTAVRRFRMMEQRMAHDSQLRQQYVDFMNEYHALGHMQKVDDYESPPNPCYHLPHHAVLREESTTTKVRVVYDASCKTSQGRSLNDALMVGPIVQEEMRSIIMRGRTHRIMLVEGITYRLGHIRRQPPDCLSRGTEAETILHDDLWWRGPPWLHLESSAWPNQPTDNSNDVALPEARKLPVTATAVTTEPSFIDFLVNKFSNYNRLLRVVAYCRRFLQNCRSSSPTTHHFLSSKELEEAEAAVIRLVQQQSFNEEWKALQKSQPVSSKSKLRWFQPFIANDQLMRIGGRLNQAPQPFESKHQIILPAKHPLSTLLLRSLHLKHLHAAPQLLVTILRLRYWITGARNLAKIVVHNCVICVRARPKQLQQFMSELPASRVTASRPFLTTGVDYWGPILLQPPHRRATPRKAYVAVFVCSSTRAVHLELVADLTTAKFLQALRRFVARRGLCHEIHSDNGRNFIGAANELRKLIRSKEHHQAIADECAANGIRWCFNPPKASHFGGLWEAAIQSAQKHFVRVLGSSILPHDDMEMLLSQIECCLNSRPITPLNDDPTDLEVLTPGHFLIGSALKAVPDVDVSEIPYNRLTKWQQVQKMFQSIWKRWHLEYLATLQPRTKWCDPPITLEKGQLVLLMDERSPPMVWPTARIEELHPGADGNTRVVTLRTAHGSCTRPVSKICLLPIPSSNEKPSATTTPNHPEAESKQ